MKLGGFPERIWRVAARADRLRARRRPAAGDDRRPRPAAASAGRRRSRARLRRRSRSTRTIRAGAGSAACIFLGGWALRSDDRRFGGDFGDACRGWRGDRAQRRRHAVPLPAARRGPRPGPVRSAADRPRPAHPQVEPRHRGDAGRRGDQPLDRLRAPQHDLALPPRRPRARRRRRGRRRCGAGAAMRGPEAMVRLADGRFLVFAEGRDDGRDHSDAVLFDGDPGRSGHARRSRCATAARRAFGSPTRRCCPTAGC